MFAKYDYNSYMNLTNVQSMELKENKIIFLCNLLSKKPGKTYEFAMFNLFPVESASFPSKEDAGKWLKIYVEAYSTGKLEKQPDYWD